MRRVIEFFKAFSGVWLALMSGPPTVPLTVAAFFVSNNLLKILFATLAVLCAFIASFRVWSKERTTVEEEIAKRGRPELTANFQILAGGPEPTTLLRLRNSSSHPAVGIHIDDIRNGTKVLRFFPPESLPGGTSECIQCQILESGWREKNNLSALFDRNHIVEQIRRGKMSSDRLWIRVIYNNLDDRLAQKTWVLTFDFWYDYQQSRIFSGTQSLEQLRQTRA
jgi:hypothetical protein